MKEAHHIYTQENKTNPIGLSKFCELCPVNIKVFDKILHNVYACLYHKNICLLLLELEKFTNLYASFNEFVSQITCDELKECKKNLDKYKPSSEQQQMTATYNQWQTMYRSAEKMSITTTVGDHRLTPF